MKLVDKPLTDMQKKFAQVLRRGILWKGISK